VRRPFSLNKEGGSTEPRRCVAPPSFRDAAGQDHFCPWRLWDVPTVTEDACLSGRREKMVHRQNDANVPERNIETDHPE
jgi:hypothetical protein